MSLQPISDYSFDDYLAAERELIDEKHEYIINPTLLIEVLSPSTEGYDRGGKFALYRTLPSLQQYVMVAQDRISVDIYTREDSNRWLLTAYDRIDNKIPFDAINCAVPMAEIYNRVPLDQT